MKKRLINKILLLTLCCFASATIMAQGILKGITNRVPGMTSGGSGGTGGDSLLIRNKNEDSISISYYYLDIAWAHKLDSSISEFKRFPIPSTYAYIGNTGSAAHSLLFAPDMTVGWDPGFHALDIYKYKVDQVRFFNTTRPYTELGYELASRSEQIIEIFHTQNIKPYWNFSLNYRLISAPGYFRNQKNNHNNYLFTSWYQAPAKRYNNYLILLGNNLQATENGGVQTTNDFKNPIYSTDPFTIPTKIGGDPTYVTNFFSKTLFTGNKYTEFTALMRQQYDFGRKDS
ncbi:MAG: putative porin, partial [Cytophagaceae bacterium]